MLNKKDRLGSQKCGNKALKSPFQVYFSCNSVYFFYRNLHMAVKNRPREFGRIQILFNTDLERHDCSCWGVEHKVLQLTQALLVGIHDIPSNNFSSENCHVIAPPSIALPPSFAPSMRRLRWVPHIDSMPKLVSRFRLMLESPLVRRVSIFW